MASSLNAMANRLQVAINGKFGEKLLLNRQQWYSEEENRPVTLFVVKKSVLDEEKNRKYQIELYSTYSQINLVFFLRNYWYRLNGWEVPDDNERYKADLERYNKNKQEGVKKKWQTQDQ